MLYALEGIIALIEEEYLVLSMTGGWHLQVWVPRSQRYSLEEPLRLLTILKVREDRLVLYGFSSSDERKCFEWLTEIPGIGAKTALQVLRNLSPEELAETVQQEQTERLVAVPGIGPSSAKKMIPYLADKFKKWQFSDTDRDSGDISVTPVLEETRQWLMEIGLSQSEADQEIRAYQKEHGALSSCEETVAIILQKRKR